MRFVVDHQLPPALAAWLNDNGHEAFHTSWKGLGEASDDEVWRAALRDNAVVVSKDADFARLRASRPSGPQVLWVRVGNMRNSALVNLFALNLARLMQALERGEDVVQLTPEGPASS